jgi:hypothetical protein
MERVYRKTILAYIRTEPSLFLELFPAFMAVPAEALQGT